MKISTVIASVFSAFLISQGALAALTAQQVVVNIDIVATMSRSTNTALSQITTITPPDKVKTIGQTLAKNFITIINALAADVTAMQATPPFRDGVTQPIVDALRNFVAIHQALLSTVIGKHGIFAQFGATGPILLVLRNLEAQIDAFAFAMIDLIPTRKKDVQSNQSDLDSSVGNSIQIYTQICIPSIFYPRVMPICV